MRWSGVWVGGRSLLEQRDNLCLLSIRRHQRSTTALPFLEPGKLAVAAGMTGE